MIIILGAPVPVPHPFIGLVFDPMDWIPKIGASVTVNGIPRANSGTNGMLGTKVHIPIGGPFAMAPTIGHESMNVFGSPRVKAEGSYFSGAGFMVMSCNDVGIPLSITPGKKFKPIPTLYLPTSASIPIPGGKPVIVGGPYVPDLMGMLMGLVMSFGFGALMKIGGKALKKALTALNKKVLKKFKCTQGLSKKLCKHGFEPVNLVTGSVLYEGVDFEIPGIIPIKWERNWYSDSDYEGLLGHGTHLCYDLRLEIFEGDNAIGVMLPDGRATGFPLLLTDEGKFYHRSEKLTLTRKGENKYELFDHVNQLTYVFERLYGKVFKHSSIYNLSGISIKFYYNKKYCLEKIVDTAGREILIELDEFNRVVKVEAEHRGSRRKYIEYAYNEAGDLIAIIDAYGKTTIICYQDHLMIKKTDRNGQTFYWEYDGNSTGARCIHTFGDGGVLSGKIEYKEGYNIVTNSLGEERIYYYDENNLCIQETDQFGNSIFHEYTDFLELYRDIDEEGNITGYSYDDRGNVIAVQKPDASVRKFLYDESGKLTMITDAEGNSTVYVYKRSELQAVISPDSSVTTYKYNDVGLIQSVTNSNDQKTSYCYDDDLNLSKIILPDGADAVWLYDAWGRCLKTINPAKQLQEFKYDLLDRVTRIRKLDGNVVYLTYNAYRNVVHAKDADHDVRFEYTALGQLKARAENGRRVQFNYDTEERLISLINAHKEVYSFKYDSAGKIVEEIGFDGIIRKYVRNKVGKITKAYLPGNKFAQYEYDVTGRLTRAEYSDGDWEVYSYDKNGQVVEAINAYANVIIERDAKGRVLKDQQNEHYVTSKYNVLGKRIEVCSSLGASIKIERDDEGYVGGIRASLGEEIEWEAQLKHNSVGLEYERILPGGITSAVEYDRAGHPIQHRVTKYHDTIRHRIYSWNSNDRLQSMMNGQSKGIVQYGYDDFGNLAWAKYDDDHFDYRMPDKLGNLFKTPERKDQRYGPGGRLLESNGKKYTYDEEGNMVSKTSVDGEKWLYEWSGNGTLQKVILPDKNEVTFEYDALGRRIAKTYNGHITRWVWDGNTPLHEWKYAIERKPVSIVDNLGEIGKDSNEPLENLLTWIFTEGSLKPAAKLSSHSIQSIITNYLGTPVEMYDRKGHKTWEVEYDIYGKVRKQIAGNSSDCPFRYQGQYADEESGLYYNRFRYFAPDDGIYISQDPIGLNGGINPYLFSCDTNTIIDLFGLVAPNNLGGGPQHGGTEHNSFIDNLVQDLSNDPLVDPASIRKNQQQVDVNGNLAGTNRPDLQYNRDGVHHNVEVDTTVSGSAGHQATVPAKDPNSRNTFYHIDDQGNIISAHSVCP
jgi:RHS repeat-associated protein